MSKGWAEGDCPLPELGRPSKVRILSHDCRVFFVCRFYVGGPRRFKPVAGRKKKSETVQKPSVDLDRSFGPNLRRLRYLRGHSQEKLAQLADVHRTEIGLLERGEREPKFGIIAKLAGALEVSADALFEGLEFVPSEHGQGRFSYATAEQEPAKRAP
jgi:DNA-binding XRE family transcriptional regulator